jgi:hypothetical protein
MPAHKKPGNTARSETVTVRLDPKIHYLASIAARYQQRTLSGFIERAVRQVLSHEALMESEATPGNTPAPHLSPWLEGLWDVDESDRIFKLATFMPSLMTIAEQRLWKLFTVQTEYNKKKISIQAFREFWNDPSINTSHLKDDEAKR